MNPELQNPDPNPEEKPTSYTPEATKRDDIPALEQQNYIQDRQPTYMRAAINENFNKKTHRHWISNLIISILLIGFVALGYHWWTNMDGKYYFRLVQLSTYADSDISIALPKNYQTVNTENSNSKTIKYYRNNAGDKVLAIQFMVTKSLVSDPETMRDNSKKEKEADNTIVNILAKKSGNLYILSYDQKKVNVITKHVKEVYFIGKTNSYQLVFYDDMTDSDFAVSISYIIDTLEIK